MLFACWIQPEAHNHNGMQTLKCAGFEANESVNRTHERSRHGYQNADRLSSEQQSFDDIQIWP